MITEQFLTALDPGASVFDFRAFHDRERGREGIAIRGTFAEVEPRLRELNAALYGIHYMINATNGQGRKIEHVTTIRAQLTDLDKGDIAANYGRIITANPLPHAIVNTSPGKMQVLHFTIPHADKQLFTDTQRRLSVQYGGDEQFIDVAHTARLPGFYHHKQDPFLVTLYSGPAWGTPRIDPWAIAASLMHIPVSGGNSERKPLGTEALAAPDIDWLIKALWRIDPNSLSFHDWIAITAAFKQAGWRFGEAAIRSIWDQWCAYHRSNDHWENNKQWGHIDATQSGWRALLRHAGMEGEYMASNVVQGAQSQAGAMPLRLASETVQSDIPERAALGTYLTPAEQSVYFQGCYWIESLGRILTPSNTLMDANRFNGTYGGRTFQLSNLADAKTTDEPWKAATRGLSYNIPRVHHTRFLPTLAHGAVVVDELGRRGVNTYRPIVTRPIAGDVSPWTDHLTRLFPNNRDREIVSSFMAFCVQYPGIKAGWAPLIQSVEGAGKTAFKLIMQAALGDTYIHGPNAAELVEGGGKFNGWLRNKLMIIVDEIRVNASDTRDLVEVLKPLITDSRVEVQSKGVDQDMQDNPTNWLMFTNYKDALPINDNSRRFCIMYSAIQSAEHLERSGMTGVYFNQLFTWLRNGGASAVAAWLGAYAIPGEFSPLVSATRAPQSSSHAEALLQSRGTIEQLIADAVEGNVQGFRGGWISSGPLAALIKENIGRNPGPRAVAKALENLGYYKIGRSTVIYNQEFGKYQSYLYNTDRGAIIANYGKLQGYL